MADIKKLAEELTKLTVLEVNELKNHLKEEYGIEPLQLLLPLLALLLAATLAQLPTKRLSSPSP